MWKILKFIARKKKEIPYSPHEGNFWFDLSPPPPGTFTPLEIPV